MKEHYKSQFHLYNLHRVTSELNPVGYEEYIKRKEALESKKKTNKTTNNINSLKNANNNITTNYCDICYKTFSTNNKLSEHLSSRAHKQKKLLFDEKVRKQNSIQTINSTNSLNGLTNSTNNMVNRPSSKSKDNKKLLTAKENHLICFVCNYPFNSLNENKDEEALINTDLSLEKTLRHLKEKHNFEFPLEDCLKNTSKALKLIATKIFKYGACLYCDSQKFPNPKAIQCHMKDTNHIKINYEDIIEYFYKFYSKEKIALVKGQDRKKKEFQLLKRILLPKKKAKTSFDKEGSDWEEIEEVDENKESNKCNNFVDTKVNSNNINANQSNNNSSLDNQDLSDEEDLKNINYVRMDNGELMLKDGTILGNKMYRLIYKQRVRINQPENEHTRLIKLKNDLERRKLNRAINKRKSVKHWGLKGSNKSNFTRVNTLFKARKQVNV